MRMTDTDMPFMALYDIQWWEEVLTDGHEAEFDFADIKVTKDYLSNGYRVLLYEFPNADKAPLAKYGAIVIDENGYATYFTTEKDENPKLWYLCMPETDAHKNCGSRRECRSLDEFKKQIEAHYDGTDERYYGDEDSGKGKKNLRKSLIYAIFAIFVGLCVAVAL